jgi:pimeloyl-ACP methyl ester carboxylesterase
MRALKPIGIVAALLLQLLPTFADDVITNFMSPIASYQYPEDFSSEVLTNGGIVSPIASYQYYEWPSNGVLNLQSSPMVSYSYPSLDTPLLTMLLTNRTPTVDETTPVLAFPPPSITQLETFEAGAFTANPVFPLNTNQMTVVLTHGWNSNPNSWASNMAALIVSKVSPAPNIVAWDWDQAAAMPLSTAAASTKAQGLTLGAALLDKLGSNYSMPIHFIGHSMGTLVNATAADYLQTNGYPWQNIQMTLFDEAEIAKANLIQYAEFAFNFSTPQPYYGQPLPKQYAWADNYVSAVGLLHTNAVNVILTNGLPTDAPNFDEWWDALVAFHGYPYLWYDNTVVSDTSAMGFRWSFEEGGFSGAPTNSVFIQSGSEFNLVETNFSYATDYLNSRRGYLGTSLSSAVQPINDLFTAKGQVNGELYATGPENAWNTLIQLNENGGNNSIVQNSSIHALGLNANNQSAYTNVSVCAWLPVAVPSNAVSMSFDFKLQGDGAADSFVAALNGTNVLSVPANQIETNILVNSGVIDASGLAGQTVELFFGIIGCSSTNAQATVQDIDFYSPETPLLQLAVSTNTAVASWPLWANSFTLETADNLSATNSWTTITNTPSIINLQNSFIDQTSEASRFYRLRQQ